MNATESTLNSGLPSEDQQIEELLASMVEMIKQREHLALEKSFARIVGRLTEAKTLTLYRLKTIGNEISAIPVLYFVDSEIAPLQESGLKAFLLSSNPATAERLSKSNVADMFQDTAEREMNLILPLRGANAEVSDFLQIENACNDTNIKRVLSLLLEFHQNFLSLLDDNERDNLTGLLNRKTLAAQIEKILRSIQNRNRRTSDIPAGNYCLAMFDIDHFKHVNDLFGHIYGDEVLLQFANLMRETFRENDELFRYGGEEFVALLHNIDAVQAKIILEHFLAKVGSFQFPHIGQVTASIGFTLIRELELPLEIINRADSALYYAKQHGRNQVRAYEELVAQGLLAVCNHHG
ncbi:MAG: GGDEF domain-containing protein [Gallionella sp.]|nr:GGDEF domain-containing protein [Gallionella sp.]